MTAAFGRQYQQETAAGGATQAEALQKMSAATGSVPSPAGQEYAKALPKTAPNPLDAQKKQNEIALQESRLRESEAKIRNWDKKSDVEKQAYTLPQLQDDYKAQLDRNDRIDRDIADVKANGMINKGVQKMLLAELAAKKAVSDAKVNAYDKAYRDRLKLEGLKEFAGQLDAADVDATVSIISKLGIPSTDPEFKTKVKASMADEVSDAALDAAINKIRGISSPGDSAAPAQSATGGSSAPSTISDEQAIAILPQATRARYDDPNTPMAIKQAILARAKDIAGKS
jgi:hypothetical protein